MRIRLATEQDVPLLDAVEQSAATVAVETAYGLFDEPAPPAIAAICDTMHRDGKVCNRKYRQEIFLTDPAWTRDAGPDNRTGADHRQRSQTSSRQQG